MTRQLRMRGVTLGEAVLLVLVLGLALAIIIPALCRVRHVSPSTTCGANLAGLGKAMLIYANDYDDELPRAGGPGASWAARTPNWMARDRFEAYGMDPNSQTGGQASMSASLYLLVKYMEVDPNRFVCTEEENEVAAFELAGMAELPEGSGLIDAWDFGPEPPNHVSFSYHMGYGSYPLMTTSGTPEVTVAADRNPWIASPFAEARDFSKFQPDTSPFAGTVETALRGNATTHNGDGQNVLFLDSHVEFCKRSYCGPDRDNVYTSWKGDDKVRGNPARFGSVPAHREDSLLVNDPAKP